MKYDVIIVGAGPAGSTAAKFLSEKGVKTLLLDKDTFPREKPCGGGLTIKAVIRFPYIRDKGLADSYSYAGCVYSSKLQYKAESHRKEPIIAMVRRKHFDHELVKLARESGAIFKDGFCVVDIQVLSVKITVI